MNKKLTEYLIQVNNLSLNEEQKRQVSNLFYSVSDIERIGDHAENFYEIADEMAEKIKEATKKYGITIFMNKIKKTQ